MTALLLLAVLVLVFINGYFVAAEFALVRARRSRIEELAEEGSRPARRVLQLLDNLSQYLSACQFGITLASLGIGFLGEPAIADLVEPALGDTTASHIVAIAIAYVLVTTIHITLGEQIPKIFSIVKAESTALVIAGPLIAFNAAMRPFITALNAVSNAVLRLVKVDPDTAMEEGSSPEELRLLIGQARAEGHLDPGESGMLEGVFHLHEQEARQVMTPIPAVVTVDTSEDAETALRRCISSGHTRLLVTEDSNQDRVKGIVHSNSLARAFMADGPGAALEPLVTDAPIVPETKPLDDLLAELQRLRTSMAVVVDEYGRVAGIVTVEDIIEEVVGEIDDETDPAGGEIRHLANGDWFVRGHVALSDLVDRGVDLPLDSDSYNSVGGYVFGELGRLPRRGDTVTASEYSIRVESVRENRVEAVRIRQRGAPIAAAAASDG
ncbi:MAG: hemolysin family protein [Actinomycetota bacterium]|nr:hemolysin family protein [Actinomycetota bacterium]